MPPDYTELQVTTNFSFLRGASHPQEIVWRAAELGYKAIGISDFNTLAGVVRAHTAAKDAGIALRIGCRLELSYESTLSSPSDTSPYSLLSVIVYPISRKGYAILCRLLTKGRLRVGKNEFLLSLDEFLPHQHEFSTIIVSPFFQNRLYQAHEVDFTEACRKLRANAKGNELLSLAITSNYGSRNRQYLYNLGQLSRTLGIPLVATNDIYFHTPERRPLQDVLTCIRLKTTVEQAGYHLFQNSERYLKPPKEIYRLFREYPQALERTLEISEQASGFSLNLLKYEYPIEIYEGQTDPFAYLEQLTFQGARERYPEEVPEHIRTVLHEELALVRELQYEKYFLTCYDIVRFARSRGILCQGRGAAANSSVCYCLGITSVDPAKIDLLFARFVSKERSEPPDIDIDFEHERREEVIQYIYGKYGRERAGLTCEVVTYRARSAVREVGKALGLSLDIVDRMAKSVHHWTSCKITSETLREIGLNPFDTTILNALVLTREIVGFPRHLSQHVGGFVISQEPLCETVPILNAGMEDRTIIEWDKNDIEELGMLKIDVLGLGMLTCIRKALELVNARRSKDLPVELHTIPPEDPAVYDMLCKADTVGVFQVESRAQMSMLPRLKPRCFYDIVIEVAIVRPGPIQGNMVHPYLRRRTGEETYSYPDERVKNILGKTFGVPIFQEQAMRLAIVLANFSPGEAEKLRRAMAAWKVNKGVIETFKEKIVKGMLSNGYSEEFAETCLNQIKGFSEYGFPESHAASFALLVYASAWLKCHYPAEFACALLNSQPMGFYAPSQIVRDAAQHGVDIFPIDASESGWDCKIEYTGRRNPALRLGLRLVRGLPQSQGEILNLATRKAGAASSIGDIWQHAHSSPLRKSTLRKLAAADAFGTFDKSRRTAHWEIAALPPEPAPLDSYLVPRASSDRVVLPSMTKQQEMLEDYRVTGLSLRAHPLDFIRKPLKERGVKSAEDLSLKHGMPVKSYVTVAGLAIIRQRPGAANGVVFLTLEDETGVVNLILRPAVFDRCQKAVLSASTLIAHGKLQRIGDVIYVEANDVHGIDWMMGENKDVPFPNRSYSY